MTTSDVSPWRTLPGFSWIGEALLGNSLKSPALQTCRSFICKSSVLKAWLPNSKGMIFLEDSEFLVTAPWSGFPPFPLCLMVVLLFGSFHPPFRQKDHGGILTTKIPFWKDQHVTMKKKSFPKTYVFCSKKLILPFDERGWFSMDFLVVSMAFP